MRRALQIYLQWRQLRAVSSRYIRKAAALRGERRGRDGDAHPRERGAGSTRWHPEPAPHFGESRDSRVGDTKERGVEQNPLHIPPTPGKLRISALSKPQTTGHWEQNESKQGGSLHRVYQEAEITEGRCTIFVISFFYLGIILIFKSGPLSLCKWQL